MSGIVGIKTDNKSGRLGRVYERGTNSNGQYVKFEDGTMLCQIKDVTGNSDPATDVTWTYPHAFASGHEPMVAGMSRNAQHRIATGGTSSPPTVTAWVWQGFQIVVGGHCSYTGANFNLTATGRWY